MQVKKLHESEYARICFLPEQHTLELEWLQFAGSDAFRETLEKALQLAKQQKAKYWLGNNTHMRTIRATDQEWTYQVWFPKLAELNLAKMAVVESVDAMNRMSVKNILTLAAPTISFEIKHFPTKYLALRWLSEN